MTSHFRACPDSSFRDTVYVAALPVVNLGADTALCLDGAPITLFNLRSQPGRYRSVWNTGDTTDTLVIRHYGNYRLQVRTPEGCTASETIVIKKSCYINIPNAFTPNGDGVNDYFFPRQLLADRLTEIHLVILNRWGEVVFETHDPNGRGWDGKLNGKPQPEGVYIYQVQAEINDVHHESYQGNVTLIR